MAPLLTSCLNDDDNTTDFGEWRQRNLEYLETAEKATIDGKPQYTKYVPAWAPGTYVLMQWHNDTMQTRNNMKPLSNSTADITYMLRDIDGDTLDSSFSSKTYGDSISRCKPSDFIVGMQYAVTNMHVGDSITVLVPYTAGYGVNSHGSVLPFSTLIFDVKLKAIQAFEKPYE